MQIYSNDRRIDRQKILVCLRRGWDGKAIRFRSYNHRNATNSTFSPILESGRILQCEVQRPRSPCKPISSWIAAKSHRNGTMTTPNPNGFESLILSLSPSAGGKFLSSLRNVFLPVLILPFSSPLQDFTKKKKKETRLVIFITSNERENFQVLHACCIYRKVCVYIRFARYRTATVSPLNGNFRGRGRRRRGGEWTQPGGEHFLSVSLIYRGIGHQ